MVNAYKELGYTVHTQTATYTIMLKQGKVNSAVVIDHLGLQPTRVLPSTLIDKLLLGEDIMATAAKKKAVSKKKVVKKAAAKKKAPAKKAPAKKAAAKKTTAPKTAGYKGHRVGSNKGSLHEKFDTKKPTRAAFVTMCEAKGIAKSTASSWFSAFSK